MEADAMWEKIKIDRYSKAYISRWVKVREKI